MKLIITLFFFFFPVQNMLSQHIKLDAGVISTGYWNKTGLGIIDNRAATPAVSLGIDYFEQRWFYLSSQIGYTKIGGVETFGYPDRNETKELKSYIHLNTTVRSFIRKKDLTGFVGIGPYFNVLAGNNAFSTSYYEGWRLKSYLGARGEIGFHFDVNRVRFGLTGSYMYSLTPAAKSTAMELKNNNVGAYASIGIKI